MEYKEKSSLIPRKVRDSARSSLLYLLYECPFIDTGIACSLFNSYGCAVKELHYLVKEGLVESFDGIGKKLIVRKGYCLSANGIEHVRSLISFQGDAKRTAADESYPNRRLYLTGLPVLQNGLQRGGQTHFKDLAITYLWLQLRWHKPQDYSLMWDNVKMPELYPLVGRPDIIFYDGINWTDRYFEDLMIVEFETWEKSNVTIYDRIEALTQNEFVCLLIVSNEEKILKNYVNGFRKALPYSSYFNGQRTFGTGVCGDEAYLNKIWFLKWDALNSPIKNNNLLEAKARRGDHPDFDVEGLRRFRPDNTSYLDKIPHERWKNSYEVDMKTILDTFR